MRRTVALVAALLIALGLAACGDDDDSTGAASGDSTTTTTTEAATSTTATTASATASVAMGDSQLGPVLVDAEGKTVYMFKPDSIETSACTDTCAQAWPPLTVDGKPAGGEGVDAALLGTAARPDGTSQVTYNGHRLYRFSGDAAPGDTKGQGAGGVWYALTAAGEQAG